MGRVRKAQETRDRILDSAEDVFNSKGVSHTTLSDIAENAGVTRGAIYWHFKNKVDLFEAMCFRVHEPMTAMIDGIADGKSDDPLGELLISGEIVMRQVIDNMHYRKVLNILFHKCEYIDASSEILVSQKEWRSHRITVIQRVLEYAKLKKQVPDDLDIRLASTLLHSTFTGLLSCWLFMPESFCLVESAAKIHRAMLESLTHSPSLRLVP